MKTLTSKIKTTSLVSILVILCTTPLCSAYAADESEQIQQLADRAEIQELIVRYVEALDTRNDELYVSVFTEDAEFDVEGTVYKGHDEIRTIVTGLQNMRTANEEAGRTNVDLFHAILNSSIQLIDEDKAFHRSYWQTLSNADNTMRIGAMGIYEDEIVKVNGEWKIKNRVLTNFITR